MTDCHWVLSRQGSHGICGIAGMVLVKGSDRIRFDPLPEGHLQVFDARNVPDEIGYYVDGGEVVPAPKYRLKVRDADDVSVEVVAPHPVELVDQKIVLRLTQFVEWHRQS